MIQTAIILAGGFGTRLRSVVPDVPKPMAPINGKPFLEYQLDYLISQGINSIYLAVGYKHEVISNYFGNSFKDAEIFYSVENQPLGTGGALLKVLGLIKKNEPLIILNGDTYFPIDIGRFNFFCKRDVVDWGIALFSSEDSERYLGVILGGDAGIVSFGNKDRNQSRLVNGGVYWLNPNTGLNQELVQKFSKVYPTSLEEQILPWAIKSKKRVNGYELKDSFIDIGIPDDFKRAEKIINAKKSI